MLPDRDKFWVWLHQGKLRVSGDVFWVDDCLACDRREVNLAQGSLKSLPQGDY